MEGNTVKFSDFRDDYLKKQDDDTRKEYENALRELDAELDKKGIKA